MVINHNLPYNNRIWNIKLKCYIEYVLYSYQLNTVNKDINIYWIQTINMYYSDNIYE